MKIKIEKISAIILFAVFFSIVQISYGQESYFTINGVVKSKESKNELLFVNVSIHGTSIGTVTNSEGEFVIKIKNQYSDSKLVFSHLGFENKIVDIKSLNKEDNTIYLKPKTVSLDEVTVHPLDADIIIQNLVNNISDNYSQKPSSFIAYYRETIKQRRSYVAISEAVVEIYKTAYTKIASDRVKLYKARKSTNVRKVDTLMMKLQGGPNVILTLDLVKNPEVLFSEESRKSYIYKFEDIITIDDKINYIISFKQHKFIDYPLFYGKLYIDAETMALNRAEFSLNLEDQRMASQLFIKKKPFGVQIIPTRTKYIVKYKFENKKYFFNYARSEVDFKVKWKKRLFNSNFAIMSEIVITDIDMQNVEKIPFNEMLKPNDILVEEVNKYFDKDFWGEFNYIEPEESIESALEKIERKLKRTK